MAVGQTDPLPEEWSSTLWLPVWQMPFVVAHDAFVTRRRTGQEACPTSDTIIFHANTRFHSGYGLCRHSRRRASPPLNKEDAKSARPAAQPLLLDLHVPDGPGPFAAAILIHGGGFDEGS